MTTPVQPSAADVALAQLADVPPFVIAAIREIESGGSPRAVRFETRLFRDRTGQTIEGTSRESFRQAYAVNPQAAVESTSWGLYQVLGGVGIRLYGSPQAFVEAFDREPTYVSERLLVEWFRRTAEARDAAYTGDWPTLARKYNGSGVGGRWYQRFVALVGDRGPEAALAARRRVIRFAAFAVLAGVIAFGGYQFWKRRSRR
jgi:hypothetical protein